MSAPQQSLPFWLAHSSLQLALRMWPEESRDWGHALAAELHEIEKPFEALHWAIGGMMLFTRASAAHFLVWLKLPAGSRLSQDPLLPGTSAPILPKRSRLFTSAILAATALLLFLPHSREALSTLRASWNGYEISPADRRTLLDLAVKAEKDQDARTLAFVASTTRESEQATRLAEKAVALDSSYYWIYASRFYRPDDVSMPAEWLERLHGFDPENSYIDLCIADSLAHPRYTASVSHRSPAKPEIKAALLGDPQWVAHMEAAFRAPRYDSYLRQHWELISNVWNRNPSLSPSIIGYGLWSHGIPNVKNLKIFTAFEIQRAQQARMDGHLEHADKILREIDAFGMRMTDRSQSDLERLVGLDISRVATKEFEAIYTANGQEAEARRASVRVQQLEDLQRTFHRPSLATYLALQKAFRGYAVLFETTSILVFLVAFALALSHLVLEFWPRSAAQRSAVWRRAACRTADYAPVSLLCLCATFLLSYLPFARLFAGYRTQEGTYATFRGLTSTLWQLAQFRYSLEFLFEGTLIWWIFTVVLSLTAVFVIVRAFYHSRPVAPVAT
jgi:hypothetical protein